MKSYFLYQVADTVEFSFSFSDRIVLILALFFHFSILWKPNPAFNNKQKKRRRTMTEHKKRFVWVKDKAGNEYVCRVDDLKDPKKVDDDDLKNCLDDASRALPIGD
jgi:hypothetical protein